MDQCTLYLTLAQEADFLPLLREYFSDCAIESDAQGVVHTVTKRKFFSKEHLVFTLKSRQRDGDAFIAMQAGMRDFYAAVPTGHEHIKAALLAQLQIFTVVVSVVSSKDMSDEMFGRVLLVAEEGHGLVLLPPGNLYNSDGEVVFSHDGHSTLQSYSVTAPAALLDQHTEVTDAGLRRKQRSERMLAGNDIPCNAKLPPIMGDDACCPRTKEAVVARTLALLITSVYAELLPKQGDSVRDVTSMLLTRYEAHDFLSPGENAFLADPEPDAQSLSRFTWRYECAWVGMWALGFVQELSYPGGICDVRFMSEAVREMGDLPTVTAQARLRTTAELLDEADLIYRCHWACRAADLKGEDPPAGLDLGVVEERHRMLNWLIGYQNAEWDDVSTDT